MALVEIRHKGLKELFEDGQSRRVNLDWWAAAIGIMDHLDAITDLKDCVGVKNFHPLKGSRKNEYAMHVNGNWCITFTFDGRDVEINNLEDYH